MNTPFARIGSVVVALGLIGCAAAPAAREQARSPAQEPAPTAGTQPQYQQAPQGYPAQPGMPADEATRPATEYAEPPPSAQPPSGGSASTSDRKVALAQADRDFRGGERDLETTSGDCAIACRALGSMDRAAGRLCTMAQSGDEHTKCGDAKTRLYSARAKVKRACGKCDDVSVESTAPVPSTRP